MLALFWKSHDAVVIDVVPGKPCVPSGLFSGRCVHDTLLRLSLRAVVKRPLGAGKATKSAQRAQNAT